ncbi:hypothetical protein ZIOFF_072181 [Zingiber officinale]|uniref:Kinesin motor domain-containing protein n=1 Tax=Zingiber officinale TaxID=94328 RepID=A0A8J5C9R8_ZINOF|nr:hypothetical protein ZIOFF_072181 [Zingiber officinale]
MMMRELGIFRRCANSGKASIAENRDENLPANSMASQLESDPSRPPLQTIQEIVQNPKSGLDQSAILRRKPDRNLSENQTEKMEAGYRSGCVSKTSPTTNGDNWSYRVSNTLLPPLSHEGDLGIGDVNGLRTPRPYRTAGKASLVRSDFSSTRSTPGKSVMKLANSGISNTRPPISVGTRRMSFGISSRGTPVSSALPSVVNSDEVPHFELKENTSFWMDNNVQVIIRVRPLNNMEKSLQGFYRCLKQESAHNITWIGQPGNRFTFDHIACETVNQEMLFRVAGLPMVENCISGYNSCVFAYGQTGSGKTYTMLGEAEELELEHGANLGMIPRIFEFLFSRVKAEEESRKDEKLKYTCKCSFLEIYNEQIIDLLGPSSASLHLREDIRKGIYVENLTEYVVENANDVLKLLIQGASNRKMASTNMNHESSRSHTVCTCIIESRWDKDLIVNTRSARLNLVDLAGSERQKTSGAEGERLKEAASINKSLSTLGHVIMVLADVAQGKQRHVPYRDSRLTFLLQDSLGGNSKTMIIANVSPSICSANETLSTLRFAQRARLIQNNVTACVAVVNGDASEDVGALRRQIHLLKEELAVLKRENVSRSLSFRRSIFEDSKNEILDVSTAKKLPQMVEAHGKELQAGQDFNSATISLKQLQSLEALLAGSLRRENIADTRRKELEAEIEQLNYLVHQKDEDTQSIKQILKLQHDKVCQMESLLEGQVGIDSYLLDEKRSLSEEVQLLHARVEENPELANLALENKRLLDQLRRFQDFYEAGERDHLIAEVSELCNKLMQVFDGKLDQHLMSDMENQEKPSQLSHADTQVYGQITLQQEETLNLHLEIDILKTILAEERANHADNELKSANATVLLLRKGHEDIKDELKDSRSIIELHESEHLLLIKEMEEVRAKCNQQVVLLKEKEKEISLLRNQCILHSNEEMENIVFGHYNNENSPIQKLRKLHASLEKARDLNRKCKDDLAPQRFLELEEVLGQLEIQTTEVIASLPEELCSLQKQVANNEKYESLVKQQSFTDLENEMKALQTRLSLVTQEKENLGRLVDNKDEKIRSLTEDWERLAYEIADILYDGTTSLEEATDQLDSITESIPQSSWVGEQVERMIRGISERDLIIEELHKCLEEAQSFRYDMEWKLRSLRGATLAISEAQQQESCDKEREIYRLTSEIADKVSIINKLEKKIKVHEEQIKKAELCATVALITVNKFSETNEAYLTEIEHLKFLLDECKRVILEKDALLHHQTSLHDAEKESQDINPHLIQSQKHLTQP